MEKRQTGSEVQLPAVPLHSHAKSPARVKRLLSSEHTSLCRHDQKEQLKERLV